MVKRMPDADRPIPEKPTPPSTSEHVRPDGAVYVLLGVVAAATALCGIISAIAARIFG